MVDIMRFHKYLRILLPVTDTVFCQLQHIVGLRSQIAAVRPNQEHHPSECLPIHCSHGDIVLMVITMSKKCFAYSR